MTFAFIIPARNEELTVRGVVTATLPVAATLGGDVLVVADNCDDRTISEATLGGAEILELSDALSSKCNAVSAGIRHVEASHICLLDADCVGLSTSAVADLVEPIAADSAMMSVGTFDYGPWSWLVELVPWSTGQRAFPVELFPWADARLRGYSLELLLNEAVGRRDGITVSRTMAGVHHRSKLAKHGLIDGGREDLRMWRALGRLVESIDEEAYNRYARRLVVEHAGSRWRPPRMATTAVTRALRVVARAVAVPSEV